MVNPKKTRQGNQSNGEPKKSKLESTGWKIKNQPRGQSMKNKPGKATEREIQEKTAEEINGMGTSVCSRIACNVYK